VTDRLGIEFISVLGLDPVAYVRLAAELGCPRIGIAPAPIVRFAGHPDWSLRDDARLRRDFVAATREHGVAITIGEGFVMMPGGDVSAMSADLDVMAEVGAPCVNMLSADPDRERAFDGCGAFAEAAAVRGMRSVVEFLPGMPVLADLASATDAVRHVGRSDFGILIDAMHLFRSGGSVGDVAALDPALIGHVQLCDVPLVSRGATYGDEARHHRLRPGDGELPLAALLRALPDGLNLGFEVPRMPEAVAGREIASIVEEIITSGSRLIPF
jgi:sugar phosphate isomerase/epimerase